MKKIFFFLFYALFFNLTYSQWGGAETAKQIFESPKLKETIKTHKTVAVLPFSASISYKRMPKNFDAEVNKSEEQKMGANMQQGMYTYLLRKADKFTVSFQDIERTNILLKKAGIYNNLGEALPDSICKILGVDAIIKASYSYEKTGSEAGAIIGTVLFGGLGGKTGSGALTMQIYNGTDGEMLWRFFKEMNEQFLSNASEVMERMMRKVSRNFPYERD